MAPGWRAVRSPRVPPPWMNRTRDHEMARRDPGRKIAEERLNLGRDAETFIGRPHPCDVLVTRLLGYGEPRPHRHGDELDGGRYALSHDAGGPAPPEDPERQRPARRLLRP